MQIVNIRTEREDIITTDLIDITKTIKGKRKNKGILETTLSHKFNNLTKMGQFLEY